MLLLVQYQHCENYLVQSPRAHCAPPPHPKKQVKYILLIVFGIILPAFNFALLVGSLLYTYATKTGRAFMAQRAMARRSRARNSKLTGEEVMLLAVRCVILYTTTSSSSPPSSSSQLCGSCIHAGQCKYQQAAGTRRECIREQRCGMDACCIASHRCWGGALHGTCGVSV